jgi:hypothetical protein
MQKLAWNSLSCQELFRYGSEVLQAALNTGNKKEFVRIRPNRSRQTKHSISMLWVSQGKQARYPKTPVTKEEKHVASPLHN